MSRAFALSLSIAGLVGVSLEAAAQSNEDALQAARHAAIHSRTPNMCLWARPDDATAMATRFELLPPSRLKAAGNVEGEGQHLEVGPYLYAGRGVVITSADPRFAQLTIDPSLSQPTLPDGRRLIVSNLLWSETGGDCRMGLTAPATDTNRGGTRAEAAGAAPVLAGYRAGVTWPGLRSEFLGLMHPLNGADETVIVGFRAGADHATRVQARLPLALQGLSVVPELHSARSHLRLSGVQSDGSIIDLLLIRDDDASAATSASAASSRSER